MGTWLKIEEFCETTQLKRELVDKLIKEGKIGHKEEEGQVWVEATASTNAMIVKEEAPTIPLSDANASIAFAEKTIGTILSLHEKVLEAKDESIGTLKDENKFLKEALYSMQELYDDDQKNSTFLRDQLKRAQDELELMKRKYKLMWGKAGSGNVELSPLIKTDDSNADNSEAASDKAPEAPEASKPAGES